MKNDDDGSNIDRKKIRCLPVQTVSSTKSKYRKLCKIFSLGETKSGKNKQSCRATFSEAELLIACAKMKAGQVPAES